MQEGLHQLLEERVGDRNMRRDVVGGVVRRMRDARRKQAVGDGLRVHVREVVGVRSWISACWKAFMSLVSGPFSVSIARTV